MQLFVVHSVAVAFSKAPSAFTTSLCVWNVIKTENGEFNSIRSFRLPERNNWSTSHRQIEFRGGIQRQGCSCVVSGYELIRLAGELQSVDGYMNIALEKCEEYVNGKLRRTYGDAFVRGNNGESSLEISLQT